MPSSLSDTLLRDTKYSVKVSSYHLYLYSSFVLTSLTVKKTREDNCKEASGDGDGNEEKRRVSETKISIMRQGKGNKWKK